MYEQRKKPLLSKALFFRRVLVHAMYSFIAILVALGINIINYH